jgi:hypothetical protein
MQNKKPKYGMAGSVPGMKMTKSAKDANVLRMMADNAAMQRADAMQRMEAGGMTMMNADMMNTDADIQNETTVTCGTAGKPKCGSRRQRKKKNRRTKRRIRRSRN